MAKQLFANNASSTLASGISDSATTLTVASGHGAKFPVPTGGDTFVVTLYEGVGVLESGWEILTCTSRLGDVLTVVRGQEGTTARAWSAATVVELRLTAATMTALHAPKTASMALVTDGNGQCVTSSAVSVTELNFLDGVTSGIQAQLNAKQATVTGGAASIVSSDLSTLRALISDSSGKVAAHGSVTSTEIGYLDGATSAIQTQINAKQAAITGAATTVASSDLATSRALVSDVSGKIGAHTSVTSTEIGYLSGVSAGLQTQLSGKQQTVTGAASTVVSSNLATSRALVSDASGKIAAHASLSSASLSYLTDVTSDIQAQLNGKQATITGAASTVATSNLVGSQALVSDSSGKITTHGTVDTTELGFLNGVTSAIQTQLGTKANLSGATFTGDVTVPSINSGPLAGFRNHLINGDFRIWQRGTSTTSDGYLADRFQTRRNGSAASVTQHVGVDPYNLATMQMLQYYTTTQGASECVMLEQRLEHVYPLSGKTVTFSCWIYSTTAFNGSTSYIRLSVYQDFGSGGSAGVTTTAGSSWALSAGWNRIAVTFTIPATNTKTVGSGSRTDVTLIGKGINSQYVVFHQLQLEQGAVATPFEIRPIALELAACYRYFEIVRGVVNTFIYTTYPFKSEKRTIPTLSNTALTVGTGATFYCPDTYRCSQLSVNSAPSDFSLHANAEF